LTVSATEGKEAETKELGAEERQQQVSSAAADASRRNLATRLKFAQDRGVVIKEGDTGLKLVETGRTWTSAQQLLDEMAANRPLVEEIQRLADIAQEQQREAERLAVEESERRKAAETPRVSTLSPEEQQAKVLLEAAAREGKLVTLPPRGKPCKVMLEDGVCKIGIKSFAIDEFAKLMRSQNGWFAALQNAQPP
jgi:hypothetical protein